MDNTTPPGGDDSDEILLQAELNLHPKKKCLYKFTLTTKEFQYAPKAASGDSHQHVVNLRDIVGCDCMRGKDDTDTSAYLTLYAYPLKKKFARKKTSRSRQPITLAFDKSSSYNENSRGAEQWRVAITALLRGVSITRHEDLLTAEIPSYKKLLVLINPHSGPGKALQIFQQRVVPLLAESGRPFFTLVTKYAGHATQVVQALNLCKWAGILIVSGDGLTYEVFNGLMSRADWPAAIKLPIGVLPGGSGNALCCAVNAYCNESFLDNFVLHSSYIIAKHHVEPMDLVAVDTVDKRVYSFLSVTWGMVADIDIESEKYRNLGNARFTVGAISRIMGLRKYAGKLSFLPVEDYVPKKLRRMSQPVTRLRGDSQPLPHSQSMVLPKQRAYSDISRSSTASQIKEDYDLPEESERRFSTVDDLEDELVRIDVKFGEEEEGGDGLVRMDGKPEEQEEEEEEEGGNGQENEGVNGDMSSVGSEGEHSKISNGTASGVDSTSQAGCPHRPPVPTPLLPPLDSPVPEDWVVIEDEFLLVTASYQTHLGPDLLIAPDAKLQDGVIDLQFVRSGVGRGDILSMFLSIESAGHLKSPDLEQVKVKAFRLEPLTETGNLVVDGELVKYGPIQGQVLPALARIMVS